jgi:hypothetical protein
MFRFGMVDGAIFEFVWFSICRDEFLKRKKGNDSSHVRA